MSTTATPIRFSGSTRMRDAFATYIRYPSPRLLLGLLAATLIARVVVGQWSWWDLVVVAVLVAAQPFVEWLIHTFILHFRPGRLPGARWTSTSQRSTAFTTLIPSESMLSSFRCVR